LLEQTGGRHITIVHEDRNMLADSSFIFIMALIAIVAVWLFRGQKEEKHTPPSEVFPDGRQPKVRARPPLDSFCLRARFRVA